MKNNRLFWVFTTLMTILMASDVIVTYIATPDLAIEGNPLVKYLGLGWGALIISNVIILGYYIYGMYYVHIKYIPPLLPNKKFTEYVSMLFYNRPDRFFWMLFIRPKNWKPIWALVFYANGFALPVSRIITVFEWVLYLTDTPLKSTYNKFQALFPYKRFDFYLSLTIYVICIFYWFFREYKNNKKRLIAEEMKNIMNDFEREKQSVERQ